MPGHHTHSGPPVANIYKLPNKEDAADDGSSDQPASITKGESRKQYFL